MMTRLSEALEQYKLATSNDEAGEVRTTINLHILHALLIALELEELQHRNLDYVLDQIPLAGFVAVADPIFNEALLLMPANRTRVVKKSKWKRFCTWLLQQDWYLPDPISRESVAATTPFNTHIAEGTYSKVKALKRKKREKEEGEEKEKEKPFRLLEADWTPSLKEEFQSFDHFCTTVSKWRKKVLRPPSIKNYHHGIGRILGFQRKQGAPLDQLSLRQLLDPSVLRNYEAWSRERGVGSLSLKGNFEAVRLVAEWVFSQTSPDADWPNPELRKTIRDLIKITVDRKDRPHASPEAFEARAISMDQCWEVLKYLGWRCKDLERLHGVTKEVIDAWMDYLILAFLITTGGRQREARELTFQKLLLESNGDILVELTPEEHKTGSKTGEGRVYPLFIGPMQQQLNADLFHYRDHVRPKNLGHDYIFFIRGGKVSATKHSLRGDPITYQEYLSVLVPTIVAVTTAHLYGVENAKWTTAHDFRSIIATWVCTYGRPEHIAIYAELMDHSIEELMTTYNKMQPGRLARQAPLAYREIAANAARVQAWQSSGSPQTPLSAAQMTPPALIAMLKKLVRKLWNELTSRKRETVFESLTAAEREVLDE